MFWCRFFFYKHCKSPWGSATSLCFDCWRPDRDVAIQGARELCDQSGRSIESRCGLSQWHVAMQWQHHRWLVNGLFSRWITMDGDCGRVVGFIDQNYEKYTKGRPSNKNSITILFMKVSRHKVGKTSSWSKASLFLKRSGSLNWTFTRIYHTEMTTSLYRIRVQTFSELIVYRFFGIWCADDNINCLSNVI